LRSTHLVPLLKELLATEPLAPTIPMLRRRQANTTNEADDEYDGFVFADDASSASEAPKTVLVNTPLLYPQTNASLRFRERELGLTILSGCLPPEPPADLVEIILDELKHPSQTGKARTIGAFVSVVDSADPDRAREAYSACVPRVRKKVVEALMKAGKWTVLDLLEPKPDGGSWQQKTVEPVVPTLTRLREALKEAAVSNESKELVAAWASCASKPSISSTPNSQRLTIFPSPIRRHLLDPVVISDPSIPFAEELFTLAEQFMPKRTVVVVEGASINDLSAPTRTLTLGVLPALVRDYLPILLEHERLRTSKLVISTMVSVQGISEGLGRHRVLSKCLEYSVDVPEGFVGSGRANQLWKRRKPDEIEEIARRGASTGSSQSLGEVSGTRGLKEVVVALFDVGLEKSDLWLKTDLEDYLLRPILDVMRIEDLSELVDFVLTDLVGRLGGSEAIWPRLAKFLTTVLATVVPRLIGTSKTSRSEPRSAFRSLADRILGWLGGSQSIEYFLERWVVSLSPGQTKSLPTDTKGCATFRDQIWGQLRQAVEPVIQAFGSGLLRYPAPLPAFFANLAEIYRADLVLGYKSPAMTGILGSFLNALAPLDVSVYAIDTFLRAKDASLEREPTDLREPWSNDSVFEFAFEMVPLNNPEDDDYLQAVRFWIDKGSSLSRQQRLKVFASIPPEALLSRFYETWKASKQGQGRGVQISLMVPILALGDGDVAAQNTMAEFWVDAKETEEMCGLAILADIHS